MKMGNNSRDCSICHITFVTISLLVGIGCLACGGYGDRWFTESRLDTNVGLWKSCNLKNNSRQTDEPVCTTRDNIFGFEDEDLYFRGVKSSSFDLVLVLLIVSGGFTFLAIVTSLTVCCAGRQSWRKLAFFVILFTFLAAGSAVTAIVLSEILIRRKIPDTQINLFEHGWSAICAWTGAAVLLVSFILSTFTCCCLPRDKNDFARRSAYGEFTYRSNLQEESSMSERRTRENAGYENQ